MRRSVPPARARLAARPRLRAGPSVTARLCVTAGRLWISAWLLLPVFAVAGSPSEGWRQEFSAAIPPRAQPPTHCANSGTLDLRPCA